MAAAQRTVHHHQALDLEAAAREQAFYAFFQCRVVHRREFVEQRRDPRRVDRQQQHVKRHPHQPGVEPPVGTGLFHQPQHHRGQRQPEGSREHETLEKILPEQRRRHFVKAKARFHAKRAVEADRQFNQRHQQARQHQQGQSARDARGELRRHIAQPLQHAAKGERKQDSHFQHQPRQSKHGFGTRVVGRALMGVQADLTGKLRGNGRAVGAHMGKVARAQPQLDGRGAGHRRQKNQGKCKCVHRVTMTE